MIVFVNRRYPIRINQPQVFTVFRQLKVRMKIAGQIHIRIIARVFSLRLSGGKDNQIGSRLQYQLTHLNRKPPFGFQIRVIGQVPTINIHNHPGMIVDFNPVGRFTVAIQNIALSQRRFAFVIGKKLADDYRGCIQHPALCHPCDIG